MMGSEGAWCEVWWSVSMSCVWWAVRCTVGYGHAAQQWVVLRNVDDIRLLEPKSRRCPPPLHRWCPLGMQRSLFYDGGGYLDIIIVITLVIIIVLG